MASNSKADRPEWWDWELGFTAHAENRMVERGLSEVDVRTMLEDARSIAASRRPGRWIVRTHRMGASWHVVVEPDTRERLLMVVTAYPRTNLP